MGQRNLLPTDCRRNKTNTAAHTITFVARPVTQRQIRNTAATGISGKRTEQKEVSARGHELKRTAPHVITDESRDRGTPRRDWHEENGERSESADDQRNHDPIEILERPLDAPADHQYQSAHQEQYNTDRINCSRFSGDGQSFRKEKEDRARSSAGPSRPTHLKKVED